MNNTPPIPTQVLLGDQDFSKFDAPMRASFTSFRSNLLRVLSLDALEKRMLIRNLMFTQYCVSLAFDFFPRTKHSSAPISAHSDVVYWVTYLLQMLNLDAKRIPRYLSDQNQQDTNVQFTWEVSNVGYVQISPYGPISSTGLRPGWSLAFIKADHPSMAWRRNQLAFVKSSLQTLSSVEYSADGRIKRNPDEAAYTTALMELRMALRTAGML